MANIAITPDQDTIEAEIFIAAPPERVFQALTDPNQMPRWWGQRGMYRITEWKADLRVGGKRDFCGAARATPTRDARKKRSCSCPLAKHRH
jgi:uncharacterized protein YndB with AHSA1/START domain